MYLLCVIKMYTPLGRREGGREGGRESCGGQIMVGKGRKT